MPCPPEGKEGGRGEGSSAKHHSDALRGSRGRRYPRQIGRPQVIEKLRRSQVSREPVWTSGCRPPAPGQPVHGSQARLLMICCVGPSAWGVPSASTSRRSGLISLARTKCLSSGPVAVTAVGSHEPAVTMAGRPKTVALTAPFAASLDASSCEQVALVSAILWTPGASTRRTESSLCRPSEGDAQLRPQHLIISHGSLRWPHFVTQRKLAGCTNPAVENLAFRFLCLRLRRCNLEEEVFGDQFQE
jgi:hypothetical protein